MLTVIVNVVINMMYLESIYSKCFLFSNCNEINMNSDAIEWDMKSDIANVYFPNVLYCDMFINIIIICAITPHIAYFLPWFCDNNANPKNKYSAITMKDKV